MYREESSVSTMKWLECTFSSFQPPFLKTCTITLRDDTASQFIILIIDTNTILCAGFQFSQLNTHWRFDHDFGGLVQAKLCHLFGSNDILAKWRNYALGLACFNRHSVLIFYSFKQLVKLILNLTPLSAHVPN